MAAYGYELAGALRAGQTVLTAWSALPEAGFVGLLAGAGFDAVTLDMQHGGHHEQSVWHGIEAITAQRVPAIVRVPVGRFEMASRALDFGADAVIAPMINSVEDARAFAAFMKYPPLGERSWGPTRAIGVRGIEGGNAYLARANAETLAFAMIETRAALDSLDAILAVDGIDAVFVGPADFSIAWTGGERLDPTLDDMMDAVADIATRAKKAGKLAGIFAADPAMVPRYVQMGYGLIAAGFDAAIVKKGADAVLSAARGKG
ncbi:MAG: aldolase/citrate lyase family protein [Phyllobacteriaceae bacterium]|nr:aldolase/citrate lyase family protein [Phyllobacteriaceae bacterium]